MTTIDDFSLKPVEPALRELLHSDHAGEPPFGFLNRVLNMLSAHGITTIAELRELRRQRPFETLAYAKIGWKTAQHLDRLLAAPAPPPQWERVAEDVLRLAVPGGWIYRVRDADYRFAIAFVPLPRR